MINRHQHFLRKNTPSVKMAFFTAFLFFFNAFLSFSQTTYYVVEGGSGNASGSSWQNASGDLQDIINTAINGDQIWVAGGTYYPDETAGQINNNQLSAFIMKEGVKIYGSFGGFESNLSQRDAFIMANNPSILSGDIDKNDAPANNCYHVILNNQNGLTAAAVLDGFTITGGNANVPFSAVDFYGGGMYNRNASPTIRNCIFKNNQASEGGAMYNLSSSPKVVNCFFSYNVAINNNGAGMYNVNGTPSVTNCVFWKNNYGAIYNALANTVITNCTITGNTGYGISIGSSNIILRNSIVWNNETEIFNTNSTPTYTKTLVRGAQVGGFNGTDDPYILDEDNGNLRLSYCSPYLNTGDNSLNTETTDLDGNTRVQLGTIDLGAYESEVSNATSVTLGTIRGICIGATSFTIPYTATTGSPTLYSISGTGITGVINATLTGNSIMVNLSTPASGSSIPFTLKVRNPTTGCTSLNVTGNVTVNPLPTVSITGINPTYYKCEAAVTLAGKGNPAGGTFKINASPATTLNPALLSIGFHVLTYTYTDANGCTNTSAIQGFSIANDNQNPVITCPANVNLQSTRRDNIGNTIGIGCIAPHVFTVTATDNCSATVTQTTGFSSGSNFPLGVTTNTFVATDASGNTSTCSFTVNVFDNTPPTFNSCPPSVTINAEPTPEPDGRCGKVHSFSIPTASDPCLVGIDLITQYGNGSLYPVGTTTVIYRARDEARNFTDCGFTVTVVDVTPPIVTCPASITVNADAGQTSKQIIYGLIPFSDNCPATLTETSLTQTSGLPNIAFFPIGTTTNVFRATDASNNTSTCSFSVTVVGDVTTQVAAAALHFDGGDDYVSTTKQVTAPSTFSLEAWFKTFNSHGAILGFSADQTGTNIGTYSDRFLMVYGGQVVFGVGYNGGTTSVNSIQSPLAYNDGNFHHVAATYSLATGLKLYIDGQLVASSTPSDVPFTYTGYWRIGNHRNNFGLGQFSGSIDEVRIWNRILSANEIQAHMNCELPSSGTTGLLNYYKFNKGINNANNTALTTFLPDASGFANDGVLNGFGLTGVTSNWKFPGGVAIGTTCNLVLPVELLSFLGKNIPYYGSETGHNVLTWATAEEKNARDFDIERSSDGQFFKKIGTVKAMGSTSNYTFIDNNPVSPLHYYQLKINDLDGQFDYSKTISIQSKGKSKVKIYPSVTNGVLTIENAQSFHIINSIGQVVMSTAQSSGNFQIFPNLTHSPNLNHLPNGIYIIRGVDTEGGLFSQKIVKQ